MNGQEKSRTDNNRRMKCQRDARKGPSCVRHCTNVVVMVGRFRTSCFGLDSPPRLLLFFADEDRRRDSGEKS